MVGPRDGTSRPYTDGLVPITRDAGLPAPDSGTTVDAGVDGPPRDIEIVAFLHSQAKQDGGRSCPFLVLARDAQAADPKALLQGVAVDHFSNAEPLLGLARLALDRKQGAEAEPFITRVLELCQGKQGFRFDYTRARAEFLEARVLTEAKGRREEGKAVAEKVKTTLAGFGAQRFRRDLEVVSQWLESH
jgi:hypothetical protein